MTNQRALSLAAAALRDSRRAMLQSGKTEFAAEIFEAHDRILHLYDREGNGIEVQDIPRETLHARVLTMDQVSALNPA